ncbi:hydrolase, partial [Streptomyces parvus]
MHAGATVQRTAATLTATLALVAIPVASAGATEMTAPARLGTQQNGIHAAVQG